MWLSISSTISKLPLLTEERPILKRLKLSLDSKASANLEASRSQTIVNRGQQLSQCMGLLPVKKITPVEEVLPPAIMMQEEETAIMEEAMIAEGIIKTTIQEVVEEETTIITIDEAVEIQVAIRIAVHAEAAAQDLCLMVVIKVAVEVAAPTVVLSTSVEAWAAVVDASWVAAAVEAMTIDALAEHPNTEVCNNPNSSKIWAAAEAVDEKIQETEEDVQEVDETLLL